MTDKPDLVARAEWTINVAATPVVAIVEIAPGEWRRFRDWFAAAGETTCVRLPGEGVPRDPPESGKSGFYLVSD